MSVNFILFSFVIILILNHIIYNPLRDADILYFLFTHLLLLICLFFINTKILITQLKFSIYEYSDSNCISVCN